MKSLLLSTAVIALIAPLAWATLSLEESENEMKAPGLPSQRDKPPLPPKPVFQSSNLVDMPRQEFPQTESEIFQCGEKGTFKAKQEMLKATLGRGASTPRKRPSVLTGETFSPPTENVSSNNDVIEQTTPKETSEDPPVVQPVPAPPPPAPPPLAGPGGALPPPPPPPPSLGKSKASTALRDQKGVKVKKWDLVKTEDVQRTVKMSSQESAGFTADVMGEFFRKLAERKKRAGDE